MNHRQLLALLLFLAPLTGRLVRRFGPRQVAYLRTPRNRRRRHGQSAWRVAGLRPIADSTRPALQTFTEQHGLDGILTTSCPRAAKKPGRAQQAPAGAPARTAETVRKLGSRNPAAQQTDREWVQ